MVHNSAPQGKFPSTHAFRLKALRWCLWDRPGQIFKFGIQLRRHPGPYTAHTLILPLRIWVSIGVVRGFLRCNISSKSRVFAGYSSWCVGAFCIRVYNEASSPLVISRSTLLQVASFLSCGCSERVPGRMLVWLGRWRLLQREVSTKDVRLRRS